MRQLWVIIVLVFFCAGTALAISFSADMVSVENGKAETGKFYLCDHAYRMEVMEDDKPVVIIVNREKKVHQILNMEDKTFFEIASDSFKVLSKDPFRLSEYLFGKYESQDEGMEMINGINCKKQVIPSQKYARWFSEELRFVIRTAGYEDGQERYATEIKAIEQKKLPMELFSPPDDFKPVEDPATAAKREQEAKEKQEEALPGITGTRHDSVPCRVKIAAGGELRVFLDTHRKAYLLVKNVADSPSVYTVSAYDENGKATEGFEVKPATLEGKGRYKQWEKFNDDFRKGTPDELRISVEKGLVYAYVRQKGADRTDFYNQGGYQTDGDVDPTRSLTVQIVGDNPFEEATKGKYRLKYGAGGQSEAVSFTVRTGETLTWDYPADRGIKRVAVHIKPGQGRAKVSLIQPPKPEKPVAGQTAPKKAAQQKYIPKPKTINVFTVTHPAGTGKPLTPGKDLGITVTGVSDDASGTINFYNDRKKTKKIDEFKFKLKTNQVQTFAVSGEKNVGWASVWVHKGSFKVKLDQSPGAKARAIPETSQPPATPVVEARPSAAQSMAGAKPTVTTPADRPETVAAGLILGGAVPLMEGAKVTKEVSLGTITQVDLETSKSTEAVINFYKETMANMGWQIGVMTIQGPKGMIQLKKEGSLLTMKAKEKGQKTVVNLVMMNQ